MKTRKCTKCQKIKCSKEFLIEEKRGKKYTRKVCKKCRRSYQLIAQQKSRKRNREFIAAFRKASICARCSESDYRVLHFHHLRDKKATVSYLAAQHGSIQAIKNEIAKCIILCANCHAKEHWREPPEIV